MGCAHTLPWVCTVATSFTHPRTIDFANCSILNIKSIKIPIEKVSITRLRLSTDFHLLEQGDVLQLLSSFPKFASLKEVKKHLKIEERKKHLEKVKKIKEDQKVKLNNHTKLFFIFSTGEESKNLRKDLRKILQDLEKYKTKKYNKRL